MFAETLINWADYGFGAVAFVMISCGLGVSLRWTATNVLKPIVAAHIKTLSSLAKTAEEQKDTLQKIVLIQERQTRILENLELRVGQVESIIGFNPSIKEKVNDFSSK